MSHWEDFAEGEQAKIKNWVETNITIDFGIIWRYQPVEIIVDPLKEYGEETPLFIFNTEPESLDWEDVDPDILLVRRFNCESCDDHFPINSTDDQVKDTKIWDHINEIHLKDILSKP